MVTESSPTYLLFLIGALLASSSSYSQTEPVWTVESGLLMYADEAPILFAECRSSRRGIEIGVPALALRPDQFRSRSLAFQLESLRRIYTYNTRYELIFGELVPYVFIGAESSLFDKLMSSAELKVSYPTDVAGLPPPLQLFVSGEMFEAFATIDCVGSGRGGQSLDDILAELPTTLEAPALTECPLQAPPPPMGGTGSGYVDLKCRWYQAGQLVTSSDDCSVDYDVHNFFWTFEFGPNTVEVQGRFGTDRMLCINDHPATNSAEAPTCYSLNDREGEIFCANVPFYPTRARNN